MRGELLRAILTVQGAAALLKQLDADLAARLPEYASPDEFEHLVQWLADARVDLQQIVEALTPASLEKQ